MALLTTAALGAGIAFRDGGVYGHVDGPRFNTPVEIAQLAACGVVGRQPDRRPRDRAVR